MLKDIIPARYRKVVYALVTLAATIFGIWQASNGDWSTFVASVLTAATTGLATANTDPQPKNERGEVGLIGVLLAVVLLLVILWLVGVRVNVG